MKQDQIIRMALVAFIGAGIHFGFRSLSTALPQKFPHLEKEATPNVEVPPLPWETELKPVETFSELAKQNEPEPYLQNLSFHHFNLMRRNQSL
ncbi:MAG: hypothetical protein IPJ69_11480 [Deltaproteobacteria bacterium]|nr:MAG: hypothetical protein IPJ69_11480 [Deltaproteobacteria bacterium]